MGIGLAVYLWVVNTVFCYWLANEKYRNAGNWFTCAVFFGPVASFFLLAAPPRTEAEAEADKYTDPEKELQRLVNEYDNPKATEHMKEAIAKRIEELKKKIQKIRSK